MSLSGFLEEGRFCGFSFGGEDLCWWMLCLPKRGENTNKMVVGGAGCGDRLT